MTAFRTARRVRHAAAEMFDLVADFERYPEFVPFCRAARITRRTQGADGIETLIADMEVSQPPCASALPRATRSTGRGTRFT